ncbi:MAG TPA: 2-oxoacid:acceptor oxidoreductase family protein [Acidimicrobiia bacterium]|jgi:2-oxoglutarate ferredoxin oxidoreductase subunit gamma|nr:2-oxoacid:acceptor oxidoreductase family protein [Acidimicrobiia bacterium]
MERELLITGIGGQGVQLAGQVLARAATLEDRYVMLFGLYGGMMRGGNTDGTVVIGDAPLLTPPLVSRSWSAIGMHDEFWEPIEARLRPDALVLVNDSTFASDVAVPCVLHRIDATGIATELGHALGGSMVMTGAYAAITGIVSVDALVAAMTDSIPSYRTQHITANERALRAGFDAVEPNTCPAWSPATVAAS